MSWWMLLNPCGNRDGGDVFDEVMGKRARRFVRKKGRKGAQTRIWRHRIIV